MSWQSFNQTSSPWPTAQGAWQALLTLPGSACLSRGWILWKSCMCPPGRQLTLSVALNNSADSATHFLLLGSSRVRPAQSCLKSWLPGDDRLCPVWGQEKDWAVCEGEIRAEISVLSSLSALPATFQSRQQHDRHRAELVGRPGLPELVMRIKVGSGVQWAKRKFFLYLKIVWLKRNCPFLCLDTQILHLLVKVQQQTWVFITSFPSGMKYCFPCWQPCHSPVLPAPGHVAQHQVHWGSSRWCL